MIRKVLRHVKGTRMLALGSIIPEDWQYVDVRVIEKSDNKIVLELRKIDIKGE